MRSLGCLPDFLPPICLQFGCFWTSGQICTATSRLILHEKIAPRFHRLLKQRAESINIGDPLDESSRMGPLVNASQHAKVMQYIEVRLPQYTVKSRIQSDQATNMPGALNCHLLFASPHASAPVMYHTECR